MPRLKKSVIVVNFTPEMRKSYLVSLPKKGAPAIWTPFPRKARRFPSVELARKAVLRYWNFDYVERNIKFVVS